MGFHGVATAPPSHRVAGDGAGGTAALVSPRPGPSAAPRAARTTAGEPRGRGSRRRRSARPPRSRRRTLRDPREPSPVSRRTSGGASPRHAPSRRAPVRLDVVDRAAGSRPRRPRRMFVNDCCDEVNSLRAALVVIGDDHVGADHRVRPVELLRGLKARPGRARERAGAPPGRSARRTRRAARARRRAGRRRGSSRGSRAGRCDPAPGVARTACPGCGLGEKALELQDVVRERLCAHRVAAERAHGELVGARRPAEAEIDPSRMECLERPELLGDHERRMVREHDPAGADPDGRGRPAATCAITTAVAALAIPIAL